MRALVFHGPGDLTVEERPQPEPGPDDTLLAIIATGICGSDLHGYTGETGRRYPGQVMGHETVARIVDDRTGAYPMGTLVTVNPVLGCRRCAACDAGTSQRCSDRRVIGVRADIGGAFAERMVAPTRNLVPLPDGTPPDIGALVEPLAVGYHACQRATLNSEDILHIVGGGPIGQAVAIAARRLGVGASVVAELNPARRSLLKRLGFTTVDPAMQTVDDIAVLLGGRPTVVIDAVGSTRTVQGALDIAALGARIVLVGMATPQLDLAAYALSTGELSLIGSFCYDDAAFRETAAWASAHAAEMGPLIEARVDLDGAPEAFGTLAAGNLAAGKILVYPHGIV